MPKMKTHKGTAKRFRLTKNGKVMRMLAGPLAPPQKRQQESCISSTCFQRSEIHRQAGQGDGRAGCRVISRVF